MSHRRRFAVASLVCGAALLYGAPASANGAWLSPDGSGAPTRHRVAVAAGGSRVTVWTDVTYTGTTGPVGLVVPVPPGASLDFSTAGWFEALDAATAPRIVPPPGEAGSCDGSGIAVQSTEAKVTTIAGQNDVQVLADADEVATWASAQGLVLPAGVHDQLATMTGKRFLAVSLFGSSGDVTSPTIRVVLPGASAVLPVALVHSSQPLEVTTWLIGEGRGRLTTGGADLEIDPSSTTWNATTGTSDYLAARDALLGGAAAGSGVVEASSHDALVFETSLGDGAIPAIAREYFVRAGAKGDVQASLVDACARNAAAALGASGVVWDACPRADIGVVDGTDMCMETLVAGGTDPADLRCDPLGDDLAVGLSGLVPQATWVTRRVMRLAGGEQGSDWPISFSSGASITPLVTAGTVDASGCPQGSGSGPTGGPSGGVVVVEDPDTDVTCGCSDTSDTVEPDDDDGASSGQAGAGQGGSGEGGATGEGGSGTGNTGNTSETSGATTGESERASSDEGGCSGDTTEEKNEDDGGCDCGGTETEGDDGDDGDSSDGSSSGESSSSSDDSCGSGGGSSSNDGCNCVIGGGDQAKKKIRRRLSPIALGILAVLIPIRRATRKKKGPRD